MQLTGEQIIKSNIVTNYCEDGIQQQGLDVRLKNISRVVVDGGIGYVPVKNKTKIPKTEPVGSTESVYGNPGFLLNPGYYEITFMEGCNIPNNICMNFKTRSSLVRCGAEVLSGQFDAGFKTDEMGAFLKVNLPIMIEKGARIAQAIFTETYEVSQEYLYDGQWQNDKQRGK